MSDDLAKRLKQTADDWDSCAVIMSTDTTAALLREAAERIEELESRADDLGWAATDAQDRRG